MLIWIYNVLLMASLGLMTSLHAESLTSTQESSLDAQLSTLQQLLGSGSGAGQLTITPAGTIHFLQAFFYSDTACSTLLGIASVIDNNAGVSVASGQGVMLNQNSAYKLANNQSIDTSLIQCMGLYLTGSNQTGNGVSCQNFTDEICSGTSCTSSQNKTVSWANSPSVCATQHAYITNNGSNNLSVCDVNPSTGVLSNCSVSSTLGTNVIGIAVNNGYAAISVSNTDIAVCPIIASTGALGTCSISSPVSTPRGIAFNKHYAYVADQNDNELYLCTVSASTGALSGCALTGSTFVSPRTMVINNGYIYVVNGTNNTISLCNVDSATGVVSNCHLTGSGFNQPRGMTIYNGHAYICNSGNNTIELCSVEASTGELTCSGTTGSGFVTPVRIAINNGYAYVCNSDNSTIELCSVDASTGELICSGTTGSGFNTPLSIAIY